MLPEERDAAYLLDMLRAARGIVDSTRGVTPETFRSTPILRLAVERQFITIGEAARRISEYFRAAHAEIPWSRIVGLRNVLIHQYDEVDTNLLWRTVAESLPELIASLEPLVPLWSRLSRSELS